MSVDVVPTVIYSSMMGMTLFALFDVIHRPKQKQTLFLGGLLLLLLIHILGELFIYSGAYVLAPGLAGLQLPVRMLLGPALYFYAYSVMSPDKQLTRTAYFIALLGPIVVVLVMLPFLLISPEDKLAMATPATRDAELFKIALFTCTFAMVSFVVFTASYLIVTFRLQKQHRQQLMLRYSSIEKRSMDWFGSVLILWGGVWLLFTVEYSMSFIGLKWFGSGIVIPTLEAFVLLTFSHYALKQPALKESEKTPAVPKQPRTYALELAHMKQVADKLKRAMEDKQLYLEEDLSLKRLSDVTSVTENHISETLSQHLQTNFFQFVNGYRIEQAKSLLLTTEDNVSTIAYGVGFNSKSTFNAAFKKSTGTTPTSFRNQEIRLVG